MDSYIEMVPMNISKRELKQRMKRFENACRDSRVRLTHQRMEIFREVARTVDHPDAESVYRKVSERIPTLSLDTVYRTLWLIKDLGLITTLGPARERTRFDANLAPHHHFMCINCGLTRDFQSDALGNLELPESLLTIGHAENTQVEVKGLCLKCAAGQQPRARKKERRKNHE